MAIVIQNATIVTMDDSMNVVTGDILIEDGRIAAIGDVEAPDGARKIDASGCAVIPSFVQSHIHVCQTLMRNCADDMVLIDWLQTRIWPYEAALNQSELRASARLAIAEMVLGGTTAFLDMGTVHHTDVIGEVVQDSGIRAHIGKCMMDYGEKVPDRMMENTDESVKESVRLHGVWDGAADGRIRYAFCPRFAISCTESLLRQVGEIAADLGAFIHTHASETEFENEFTDERWGMSNMSYLREVGMTGERSVFAHGVHVSDDDCQLLADTKTVICHCPSSNLKLASGIANMPRYDKFGVRVALGADGAPCNNNLDQFVEMRLAALLQKPFHGPTSMPAERVLKLATRDGAESLGLLSEIGTLEVGKSADLVVIDLDNDPGTNPGGTVYSRIVYACHRSNVRHVFASGNQVVDKGELVGWDLGKVLSDSREAFGTVTKRML